MNYLRVREAAQYVGLSKSTLDKMRCFGTGPKYYKPGKAVLYDRKDLDDWLATYSRRETWSTQDAVDAVAAPQGISAASELSDLYRINKEIEVAEARLEKLILARDGMMIVKIISDLSNRTKNAVNNVCRDTGDITPEKVTFAWKRIDELRKIPNFGKGSEAELKIVAMAIRG